MKYSLFSCLVDSNPLKYLDIFHLAIVVLALAALVLWLFLSTLTHRESPHLLTDLLERTFGTVGDELYLPCTGGPQLVRRSLGPSVCVCL